MKALIYDCFAGMSGDMNLSALVDIAENDEELKKLIYKLFDGNVIINFEDIKKSGIRAKKLNIIEKKRPVVYRHLKDINEIVLNSQLSSFVKEKSLEIFNKIASAEAKVHGIPKEKVHFHEIGAVDTIIDVVGGVFLLEKLDVKKVFSSAIEVGSGFVETEHGKLPVPAPATAELLNDIPIKQTLQGEATTPTGAAIISSIVEEFAFPGNFCIKKIGYGAGVKDFSVPNVLRVFLIEVSETQNKNERWILIETNFDDMPPENVEYLMERLFNNGAVDVFITPIIMKKSRPAFKLSVLCKAENSTLLEKTIFEETSTFGIRKIELEKIELDRKIETLITPFGNVRVKIGYFQGKELKRKYEYEDIKRIANEKGLTYDQVLRKIDCIIFKKDI